MSTPVWADLQDFSVTQRIWRRFGDGGIRLYERDSGGKIGRAHV